WSPPRPLPVRWRTTNNTSRTKATIPNAFTQRGVPVFSFMALEVYRDTMSMSNQHVSTYTNVVPKLWSETIEEHRQAVREATLDTTAALVAEHGLTSVTMSKIAEETGIGRATLYKYFPDVEAILIAWHERQITRHLEYLTEVRN